MPHSDPRPPAADGERALPEEIVKAIEELMRHSRGWYCAPDAWEVVQAKDALATSILSRLTAAEAGREEAESGKDRLAIEAARLEIQRDAAIARVEKLEKRVNTALDDACRMSAILLMAGEMSPQERRTAQAVANGLAAKVRSALTEAQPKGDQ